LKHSPFGVETILRRVAQEHSQRDAPAGAAPLAAAGGSRTRARSSLSSSTAAPPIKPSLFRSPPCARRVAILLRFLLARLCPAVCGGIRRVPKPQQAGGGVDVRIEMRMQNAYRPEPPRSKPLMKLRHQHSGRFLYPLTRLPSYNRLLPVAHPVTSDTQRTTPRLLVCVWMDALENLLRPPRRPCPRQQPLPCRVRWLSEAREVVLEALQRLPRAV
jgi:hypothetical protein